MRYNHVGCTGKETCKDPEHDDGQSNHADHTVEEFSIKAKLALVSHRENEKNDQRNPHGHQLHEHATKNCPPT